MHNLFCTECGHKMTYTGPKPKFCSSCGVPIGEKSAIDPRKGPSTKARGVLSIREQMAAKKGGGPSLKDDETDIDYVPQIDGLEYSISADGTGYNTHKFEDVFNVSTEEKPAQKKPAKRRGRPRKTKN